MTSTLILVPTQLESDRLQSCLRHTVTNAVVSWQLCGFGPVAGACLTTQLLSQTQPDRVLLAGIAGSLSTNVGVGTALSFSRVGMYGVGAGSGADFQTGPQLGWPYFAGSSTEAIAAAVEDELPVTPLQTNGGQLLLTACAASATVEDTNLRRKMFPDAVAEDMEGFGVAMACHLQGVPLTIIRGISNVAGDRDKVNWNVDDALKSAATLIREFLQ